ncbi:MAG: hypothetical protein LBU27_06545 [Candidatus Peribacteria bacterium]|jgi:hypothetical protein|nr:hypothetical protein [Candidatus Peribacteria bacterium]
MTLSEPITPLPAAENLLTTENVGAVEANDEEIQRVEAEYTQEEVESLTTDTDEAESSSSGNEGTLQSENVDITESTQQ